MTKIFLFSLLFLLPFSEAYADEVYKKAFLSCDSEKNMAMIRFEAGWIGKPRQTTFSDTYSKYEYLNNLPIVDECVFQDGRKVVLSYEVGQAFPYGQGGGDPPAYFNLNIGDKYAYYHKGFYAAFGAEFSDPLVILLLDQILISCKGPDGFSDEANYAEQYIADQNCADESQRLVSGLENFPRELNALKGKQAQNAYEEISKNAELCDFIITNKVHNLADSQKYNFSSYTRTPLGYVLESSIDINNDKEVDKILQFGATTHYMDGVYFIVGNEKTTDSILQCVLDKKCPSDFHVRDEGSANVDDFVKTITKYWPNAYALSGETLSDFGYRTRYTNLYPVSFKNENYIYFEPLNDMSFPRAAVGQILPDKKIEIICTYKDLPNGR